MGLQDLINENLKMSKKPLRSYGLQDSNWWSGIYIQPYVREYINGKINTEFADWRGKSLEERGYIFLGHGNSLSFNFTGTNNEALVDSTKEKIITKGEEGLTITVDIVTKVSKLLASLGASGNLIIKPIPVTEQAMGAVTTPAPTPPPAPPAGNTTNKTKAEVLVDGVFQINSSIELNLLMTADGIKFAYGAEDVPLAKVANEASLKDNSYYLDLTTNKIHIKLGADKQKSGSLTAKYTGNVKDVYIGKGGASEDVKYFNVMATFDDPKTGNVIYHEAFRCSLNPEETNAKKGQNSSEAGSTRTLTFTATMDVDRPDGEQLYIEKDDYDLSMPVA